MLEWLFQTSLWWIKQHHTWGQGQAWWTTRVVNSPGWTLHLHLSRRLTYGRLGRASELKKKTKKALDRKCFTQFLIIFWKKTKIAKKNNKNPKKIMFLTFLRHLQLLFRTRTVVRVLFKSMLKLLFFKKFKIQKIRKIKICKEPNMKRKKLRDQFVF